MWCSSIRYPQFAYIQHSGMSLISCLPSTRASHRGFEMHTTPLHIYSHFPSIAHFTVHYTHRYPIYSTPYTNLQSKPAYSSLIRHKPHLRHTTVFYEQITSCVHFIFISPSLMLHTRVPKLYLTAAPTTPHPSHKNYTHPS